MRIYMQTPPTADRAPRFYHLHLQEDLLDGWTLVKETGYQGAAGRVRKEHYSRREDAVEAMIRTRDTQLSRGYHVVFAEGEHVR